MEPVGSKAKNSVAGDDVGTGKEAFAFNSTDAKAGEVVIFGIVKSRHFRCFATDQRAASTGAALGYASDDLFHGSNLETSGSEVIEKEQGLGALDEEIVSAHGDKVDSDCVVASGRASDQQLGANSVCGRDQKRVPITGSLGIEDRSKTTQIGCYTWPVGGVGKRFYGFDQGCAGIDIDAGVFVTEAVAVVGGCNNFLLR